MRAILTWHSLDETGSPISVAPAVFRQQVAWLAAGRVPVVGLAELLALPAGADAVALTFDDGFASTAELAAPLLREHGLPATVYVVTEHVGGTNAWGGVADPRVPTLPLAGWDALGRMAEAGITLGAHTRRHPHLTRLSPGALADELGGGQEALAARTGVRADSIAYPYGDVDPAVEAAAGRWFRLGVTTALRWLGEAERPLALPRLDMFYLRDPGQLEAWDTGWFRARVRLRERLRAWRAAWTSVGGGW